MISGSPKAKSPCRSGSRAVLGKKIVSGERGSIHHGTARRSHRHRCSFRSGRIMNLHGGRSSVWTTDFIPA